MTEALRPWIREAQNGSTEAVEFILQQFRLLICRHSHKNCRRYQSLDGSFGDYQLHSCFQSGQ